MQGRWTVVPNNSNLQMYAVVCLSVHLTESHLAYWEMLISIQVPYFVSKNILVCSTADKFCIHLGSPDNGHVSLSGNGPGSTATYGCNLGYMLVGMTTRICQDDGEWSRSEPSCRRKCNVNHPYAMVTKHHMHCLSSVDQLWNVGPQSFLRTGKWLHLVVLHMELKPGIPVKLDLSYKALSSVPVRGMESGLQKLPFANVGDYVLCLS